LRIGNLSGRLALFVEAGAVDVEKASGGRFGPDPQTVYEVWGEFVAWVGTQVSTAGSDCEVVIWDSASGRTVTALVGERSYRVRRQKSFRLRGRRTAGVSQAPASGVPSSSGTY
jgi:hypothetical protein